jgi:arylsulfatase A-like enzyme
MNSRNFKLISISLFFVGTVLVFSSLAADVLGFGGEPGFGLRQAGLLLLGILFLLSGILTAVPRSRDYIFNWRADRFVVVEPPPVLFIAAWFGLFAAFVEVIILGYQRLIEGKIIPYGINVIWMSPLAYILFFIALGLPLLFLSRKIPYYISAQVIISFFAFLFYFSFFLWLPQIQLLASFILALGLAVQTARMAKAHPNAFYFFPYHTFGWIKAFNVVKIRNDGNRLQPEQGNLISRRDFLISSGMLIGGLALSVAGLDDFQDRSRLSRIPRSDKRLPNIILITMDTVRAQSLSLYGYKRQTTPQLDQLSQKGVVFERAFSTAPWTLVSHSSIFTGHYPHELSSDWTIPLDSTFPTLAEFLSARGYITAGFIANTLYCSTQWGLSRGFAHYEDYPTSLGEIARNAKLTNFLVDNNTSRHTFHYYNLLGRKTAEELNSNFLGWLSKNQERPFFAFLNYFDAHAPYMPPSQYLSLFGPELSRDNPMFQDDINNWVGTSSKIQAELNAYEGAVAYIDHQLGLLFENLDKTGLLDNTILIVTSDHGELLGEHDGLMGHGTSLYLPVLKVPLLISFPPLIPAGIRIPQNITLRDIPSTIVDLLGLTPRDFFPGNTLARYWTNTNIAGNSSPESLLAEVDYDKKIDVQKQTPITKGDMKSIVQDRYHYIKNGDESEELYDFESDPQESVDLSRHPESNNQLESFRLKLKSFLQNQPVRK